LRGTEKLNKRDQYRVGHFRRFFKYDFTSFGENKNIG
jgi:hypothetical protein